MRKLTKKERSVLKTAASQIIDGHNFQDNPNGSVIPYSCIVVEDLGGRKLRDVYSHFTRACRSSLYGFSEKECLKYTFEQRQLARSLNILMFMYANK